MQNTGEVAEPPAGTVSAESPPPATPNGSLPAVTTAPPVSSQPGAAECSKSPPGARKYERWSLNAASEVSSCGSVQLCFVAAVSAAVAVSPVNTSVVSTAAVSSVATGRSAAWAAGAANAQAAAVSAAQARRVEARFKRVPPFILDCSCGPSVARPGGVPAQELCHIRRPGPSALDACTSGTAAPAPRCR